jgi:hypothetical protein
MSGPLKEVLRGRRFSGDDDVKAAVHLGYALNQKHFFLMALKSW